MIESPNPVTMNVNLYFACRPHTHTQTHPNRRAWSLPTFPCWRGVCARVEGHTTRHPLLMDERHYSSWGQVPVTIKGPGQWLGKNGSGKWEWGGHGKGNCCRRTGKHKRCGRNPTVVRWRERKEGITGRWNRFAGTGFYFFVPMVLPQWTCKDCHGQKKKTHRLHFPSARQIHPFNTIFTDPVKYILIEMTVVFFGVFFPVTDIFCYIFLEERAGAELETLDWRTKKKEQNKKGRVQWGWAGLCWWQVQQTDGGIESLHDRSKE